MIHTATYRNLRPVYDRYRQSGDKKKFLRGHESDIILFEAATRELKRMGTVTLSSSENMKTELAARSQTQEYETIRKNVDALLSVPKEQAVSLNYDLE